MRAGIKEQNHCSENDINSVLSSEMMLLIAQESTIHELINPTLRGCEQLSYIPRELCVWNGYNERKNRWPSEATLDERSRILRISIYRCNERICQGHE